MEKMPLIDPNCTESESYGNICSKNHCNLSDKLDVQELMLDNSKDTIDNCKISRVDDEMT